MDENLESEIPLSSESDAQKPKSVLIEEEGFMPIKAPMLGTFYRAPKPEAPPFVKEGQFVKNDDVVCIIEVMKLFNMVRAGVQGRIAKICAENAQLVEYNQVLFLVEKVDAQEKAGEDSFS
jgi:acetyl-CoA carboxylase biotin carboxyl carrier protein